MSEHHHATNAAGKSAQPGGTSTYPSELDQWMAAVTTQLGIDAGVVDIAALLDFTRDVAHGHSRPAAPLTAYLLGMAQGRSEVSFPDLATSVLELLTNSGSSSEAGIE